MTEYATGITKYVIKISHDIDLSVDFRKPVDVRNKRELLVETGKEMRIYSHKTQCCGELRITTISNR